ncbi:YjfB family protein [Actimicrobium sp. CCC2.4]|uniref:YjfB family protein n=1 Tax=Actimicrobium sp. CCC2.4 TaxID=3048606 RepID=UPI002AC90368|nr:YjfB family protein [Actimicrobium sp. CCC2.4]MEB0134711.1 YjfB family protein [Actimicrobium sp. CCC2.4]WPX30654.1 YjfB family protein [Actimicrobium sp. CCC2.4]
MNASSIGSLSTNLSSAKTDQAIGIAVLKKALDSEKSTASALLDALPAVPTTSSLPSNLGRTINTTA